MYRLRLTGRIGLGLLTVALVIGFQVFFAGAAQAHHVDISAEAVCNDGSAVINYTATSWLFAPPGGENPRIDIFINNVFVASGAFADPVYTFSGSYPAPIGLSATVTAVTVGNWGDGVAAGGESHSLTVTIPQDCALPGLGRFTGGALQIRGGVRITGGLTIHCDLLLSNNLQVNWGRHRFHMLEHITTVACTDDPNIIQKPPAAPLDTLIGVGTGRYDNQDGFTIEFTLVDAGEPGTSDMAALKIYETLNPGNVVLDVPLQLLTGGNLQAHFDQPHK